MIRLLLQLPEGDRAVVQGERLHYLTHVLRLQPGATFEVFDGRGLRRTATLERLGAAGAELRLGAPQAGTRGAELTLIQGLPKADKLEWIIQKGTELGISRFAPVLTERSVVKLDAARAQTKRERWQRIAEEAARQCGRSDLPGVDLPSPLAQAASSLPEGTQLLVLDEEERERRLVDALRPGGGPLALVVGPEGGLSRTEVAQLQASGGCSVTLGPRILRTETASLAAAVILLHLSGELG